MKQLFALTAILCSQATLAQITFTNQTSWLDSDSIASSHPVGITDMNGDGLDDIVILKGGNQIIIEYQKSTNNGFNEYLNTAPEIGNNAWGMCLGDVDNNGFSDLLYGGAYDDLHLYTFTAQTSYNQSDLGESLFLQGVNFADIDNDGNLDIFACHDDGPSLILIGDGNGNFTESSAEIDTDLPNGSDNSGNYGSCFVDIDNDGDIDLYVAKCRQGVTDPADYRRINILFENNGNGTYTENAAAWGINSGEQSWSADFGDIDNDGDMDLLMGQHTGEYLELYINNGNGTFSDITNSAGLTGVFPFHVIQTKMEDFDNDGFIDILVSGSSAYDIGMNNGDGTFDFSGTTNIGCPMNSFSIGDLNTDGFIDIYAIPGGYGSWNSSGRDSLYINDGNSNNYLSINLEGVQSNMSAVGTRVEAYGPWGVQIRDVRSGESYGIHNSLNVHFGIGSETQVDSLVLKWPSGIIDIYNDIQGGQLAYYVEGQGGSASIWEEDKNIIEVYPNLIEKSSIINVEGDLPNNTYVRLTDMSGKLVSHQEIKANSFNFNTESLSKGVYLYSIRSNSKVFARGKISYK